MPVSVNEIYAVSIALFERAPTEGELAQWQGLPSLTAVTAALLAADDRYAGLEGGDLVAAAVATLARGEDHVSAERQQTSIDDFTHTLAQAGSTPSSVLTLMVEALIRTDDQQWQAAREVIAQQIQDAIGEAPQVPGQTVMLTSYRDVMTAEETTDGDDTFIGWVGQNASGDGAVSNAFSTGDFIDGGAGTDKIEATLIRDHITHGANHDMSINAITQNVEQAFLSVLDENVIVDGGRMDSVEAFWSDDSDESLVLEDIRLGSKLDITQDITFGMRDVDQQSGLSAAFDSQSLVNQGTVRANAQILVEVGDSNQPADTTDPLELIELDLNFTFNGQNYAFDNIRSTDGTYEGLIQGIKNALTEAGLTGLEVTAGRPLSSIQAENDTVPLLYSGATQIIITDPEGTEFTHFTSGVGAAASSKSSNPVSNIDVRDPSVATTLIESNLILDNAGRGSTAGDAVIGGMSNSDKYVEKLNLMVDRDSQIDDLATATGMENARAASNGMGANGDYTGAMKGFQEIELTSMGAHGVVSINDIQDTHTFNANSFQGSALTIGNADALQTLNASISGNVNVTASTAAGDNVYTTGSGTDTLNVTIDGDDIDTVGEGFEAATHGGDDAVTVVMPNDFGVSFNTMSTLDNLKISTGAGPDKVDLNGYGTFDLSAGDGSDFMRINSTDVNGDALIGGWVIGDSSDSASNFFDERVLYNATLTVSFAGYEESVSVQTDAAGNFIASQATINAAIKAAIDANPELSALLTYSDSTGNQALNITSNVGGENDLGITVYQPQLVDGAAAADGSDVSIANGDVTALRQGLIKTGFVDNSAGLDTAGGIRTATDGTGAANWLSGNGNGANWYGSIDNLGTGDTNTYTTAEQTHDVTTAVDDSTGGILQDSDGTNYLDADAGGSTDSTNGISFASINVGDGANDVVVMHSNAASANTLVVDQVFGKVSVVNWHDVSANDVNAVAQMGLHALDFSAYLDNQLDDSSNTNGDSAKPAPTVANIVDGAEAFSAQSAGATHSNTAVTNSVNLIRFDSTVTATQGFDGINASTLVAALNDANGDGSTDYGNLNDALLSAAGTNADLVGTTRDMMIMVENDLNEGEYKVFHVTADNNSADPTQFNTNAVELGTLDFGASVNLNLVGGANYTNYVAALQDALDTGASTFTYVDGNGDSQTVNTPVLDTTNPAQTYTVQQYKDLATKPEASYSIKDTVTELSANDLPTFTGATSVTATTSAADITSATLSDQVKAIDASGVTGATFTATAAQLDGVTVTSGDSTYVVATVANTADISGYTFNGVDAIVVADNATATLSLAQAKLDVNVGSNASVATVAVATGDDLTGVDTNVTLDLGTNDVTATIAADQLSQIAGANSSDNLTINTLSGAVAATDAADTFDFEDAAPTSTVTITGFGTSGADKIDLTGLATAGAATLPANTNAGDGSSDSTIAALVANSAYFVDADDAADGDGANAENVDDVIAGLAAVDADGAGFAGGSTGTAYIVATDANSTAIYAYTEDTADGAQAGELVLIGTVDAVLSQDDLVTSDDASF